MIASEARNSANRLHSTNPTQGNESSRAHSSRLGMTGESVALPREDAAEVDRRFAAMRADYRPKTEAGRDLIRRAAMLSVRLDRCAVQEAAAISLNVRAAVDDFDEARATRVDELFEQLDENAATSVRRLLRMPEGVDRMLGIWADLRSDLAHGDGSRWKAEHEAMAIRLSGRNLGGFGISRVEALSKAARGIFSLLDDSEGAGLDGPGRRQWARRGLLGLIDASVSTLETHRETLDFEAIAADRAGAASRALFDPSREATLARKYEAATERAMHKAIREMKEIEAEAAERGDSPPPLGSFREQPPSPLGSFSPPAPARHSAPAPTPSSPRFEGPDPSHDIPRGYGPQGQPLF